MEIETIVDEIIERTRHSDPLDDNAFVNERIMRADVWTLLETYTNNLIDDRIQQLTEELKAYEEAAE